MPLDMPQPEFSPHVLPPAACVQIMSGLPVSPRRACRIVQQITSELVLMVGDDASLRRDKRRTACHVRQIAMYVSHVALSIPLAEIGASFGKDRSTVGYACEVVEDRRDDRAFDDFVTVVERIATYVFGLAEASKP
jgi:hypothetical protein